MIINISTQFKLELPDDKLYTLYVYVGYLLKPVLVGCTYHQASEHIDALPQQNKSTYKLVEETNDSII